MTSRTPTTAWIFPALSCALCVWVLHAHVSPDFTPVRVELTDAHGFSRGVLNLVVLSAGAPFGRMPAWSLLLCAAALLAIGIRTAGTAGRVSRCATGVAFAFLGAVALSPYLTPYRVVLAPRTFLLCLVLISSAGVSGLVRRLAARWTPAMTGIAAAAFFASAVLQTIPAYGGSYSGFLHIARDVAAAAPFLQERPDVAGSLVLYEAGYDGQFMYLMAFDPLLRRFADRPQVYRAFIDNPPYRYGRIGFSALTHLVGAGQPARYPAAMVWLIVAAHFALATLLGWIARRHGMSPFAGLWYLAIPGFMSSLMSALPEALAATGFVAGFLCWESGRPRAAAGSLAAALLFRETGVVLLGALVLASGPRGWKRSGLVALAAIVPVCAWRLFVASRLFSDFGWASIVTNPGDLGVPFAGLIALWRAGASGAQPGPEAAGAVVFPIILTAALAVAAVRLKARRGPLEIAAAIYATVAVSLDYGKIWSHLPSGERGTFELFLCLLLLLLQGNSEPAWARRRLTGLFVVLGIYTFFIAPDASTSRAALLLIR